MTVISSRSSRSSTMRRSLSWDMQKLGPVIRAFVVSEGVRRGRLLSPGATTVSDGSPAGITVHLPDRGVLELLGPLVCLGLLLGFLGVHCRQCVLARLSTLGLDTDLDVGQHPAAQGLPRRAREVLITHQRVEHGGHCVLEQRHCYHALVLLLGVCVLHCGRGFSASSLMTERAAKSDRSPTSASGMLWIWIDFY
jgi:hypothetical protein